jgi:hypothetical protein
MIDRVEDPRVDLFEPQKEVWKHFTQSTAAIFIHINHNPLTTGWSNTILLRYPMALQHKEEDPAAYRTDHRVLDDFHLSIAQPIILERADFGRTRSGSVAFSQRPAKRIGSVIGS